MTDFTDQKIARACLETIGYLVGFHRLDIPKHIHERMRRAWRIMDSANPNYKQVVLDCQSICVELVDCNHHSVLSIEALEKLASWNKPSAIDLKDYVVQEQDGPKGYRFRLVHTPSGRTTEWQGYTGLARFTNGVCAVTEYYGTQHALKPIDDRTFMNLCYGGTDLPI